MNRPKREDYKINDWEYSGQYVLDLEKYCDEVELERGYFEMHADAFLEEMKNQEKALDKLIIYIMKLKDRNCRIDDCYKCPLEHKCDNARNIYAEWKEWAMKDE